MSRIQARDAGRALKWRAAGTLGSKLIGVARSIVLARLLVPDDFGLFAIAMVVLDLVSGLTDTGLNPALVQGDRREQRHYDVAWTLGLARGLVIAIVVGLAAPFLATAFGDARATPMLQLLAIRPVLASLGSVRTADLERQLSFRSLAVIDLASAIIGAVASIALAHTLGAFALVVGSLGAALVAAAGSYVVAPYRPCLHFDRSTASSLFRFGRWVLAGSIVVMIGEAVFRAVIARRLGTGALGIYYLAANIASVPLGMLGALIGSVAFPIHSRLRDDERRAAIAFRGSVVGMLALLLPFYAVVTVLAPQLVFAALGAQWMDAVPVIRLLPVMAILTVIYHAAEPLLQGRGRPDWVALLYLGFTVAIAVLAWPLAGAFGLAGAALSRVIADLLVSVGAVWMASRILERPFSGLGRPVASIVAAAAVAALVAAGAMFASGLAAVVVAGSLAFGAATLTLLVLDRKFDLGLRRDLTRAFPALPGATAP